MELLLPSGDGREVRPERLEEVARMPISAVAADLVAIIGLKRTAVVGDVKDTRLVQRWIKDGQVPQRAEALRTALQVARILNDVDGASVAAAWFTGCNQHFNFEAPIVVLRDSTDPAIYAKIVRAAFEFVHR
jgi:hypothetical protein